MSDKKKIVTAISVGAGSRGQTYSSYAIHFPQELQIVGVACPNEFKRRKLQKQHKIPDEHTFNDWSDVLKRDKFADCVIIATPDDLHKEPAVAFAKMGYNILLEKPMAITAEDCKEIVKAVKDNDVILVVCHVLRYIHWAKKIKEIIDSGAIGDVVNIQHTEPVGYWHFAHSFVRGNWHNEAQSSNSLLAKCCHDVDLINYWMGGRKCEKISSFGHLSHFNSKDKPPGAAKRCVDCPGAIESNCPYSAKRFYLDHVKMGNTGWPVNVVADVPDIESVTEALRTGPYGICVYQNDNDVMSNQIVNFQYEGGATASLTMMAFTKRVCDRKTTIYGTRGELNFDDGKSDVIEVCDFVTEQTSQHRPQIVATVMKGHGGADFFLMQYFVNAVRENKKEDLVTGPDETLASHLLVFAAETARKENRVVSIEPDGSYA
ncbi:hypothetical protein SNE40_015134 [Patella caerulea]|uniref:Oxidoreductase n=1 Tax=Patella caerulea TaxID=87958 RepID=A0AAN8JKE7_PATCE